MANEYASIPEPQASVESLLEVSSALKQTVEALIGRRGTSTSTAATMAYLASIANLAGVDPVVGRANLGMTTSSTDKAVARYAGATGSLQNSSFLVDDTGNVSSFGGQVAFPATQNPSADANTLDDYEEGTWTPTLSFQTPGDLNVVYASLRSGYYTKIGRLVNIQWVLLTSTFTWTTASGAAIITGLPFTVVADSNYRSYSFLIFQGFTDAVRPNLLSAIVGNTAQITAFKQASGQTATITNAADFPTGGTVALGGSQAYVIG